MPKIILSEKIYFNFLMQFIDFYHKNMYAFYCVVFFQVLIRER